MAGRGRLAQSGQEHPPPPKCHLAILPEDPLDPTWGPADPWFFGLNSYPEILTFKFSKLFYYLKYFLFIFWLCPAACEISAPQPGTEPMPPSVEAQSLNHQTPREVP